MLATLFDELELSANPARSPMLGSGRRCRVEGQRTPRISDFEMMLDAEQWKIVLKVYAGHPISALTLAYQLIAIKQSLQRGRKGIPDAITALDLAIEALYPHTDFYKRGRKFYHRTIEGTLKPEQEAKLRELGVKL